MFFFGQFSGERKRLDHERDVLAPLSLFGRAGVGGGGRFSLELPIILP
jgi:hypothetical protein